MSLPLRNAQLLNASEQDLSSNSEKTSTLDRLDKDVDATNQDDVASPDALGPFEKENDQQGKDLPAVEESVEARINRLGRQRPEVFKSMWAEVGFVFSIAMSQVLSVRTLARTTHRPLLIINRNISSRDLL